MSDRYEQDQSYREQFLQAKVATEFIVETLSDDVKSEIVKKVALADPTAEGALPEPVLQGIWHGLNHELPLSMVRAINSTEVVPPRLVKFEIYVTDRFRRGIA